jgi:uncharacterized membrane protein
MVMMIPKNVVFSSRAFIGSLMITLLVVLPRVLFWFGLKLDALELLISPWATFSIIMVAGALITYPYLKNIKFAIFILIGLMLVAIAITIYACQLPVPSLPW